MRKNNLHLGTSNQWKPTLVFSTSSAVAVRSLQRKLDARRIPSLFRYHSSSCEVFVLQRHVAAAKRVVAELRQEQDSGDTASSWQGLTSPCGLEVQITRLKRSDELETASGSNGAVVPRMPTRPLIEAA